MRFLHLAWVAAIGLMLAANSVTAQAADGPQDYKLIREFKIGGEGRWDYVTVDPAAKLLYVSRQSHTQVINTQTGAVVGDINNTRGVHGIALVTDLGRGFTSNGQAGTVTAFDLKTLSPIGDVPVGQNPDAIIYDPFSKRVFALNGRSNDASVIDPSGKPANVAQVPLGGKPEFAASDSQGHVYVNLEDKSSIAVIYTKTMKLAQTWKIDGGEEPSGLAIDPVHHHLFAGCANQVMAVIDTQTGKTLGTVPIGKGVDACGFDPGTGEAFASCGDGTLTVVKETAAGKFEAIQTVQTRPGARTMALDPDTRTIYLPTAELNAPAGQGRPAPKPNSFMILVVSRPGK